MNKFIKKISGYEKIRQKISPRFTLNMKYFYFERFHNNLCKTLVDDPIIKMPDFCGVFAIDVRSDLFKRIILYKSYETHLAKCCLELLDHESDVVDVGANVGFFSVLLAKNTSGKVLSVEPSPNVLSRLYRNINLNNLENISVYEGVVLEKCGLVDINIVEGKDEYSSVGDVIHVSALGNKIVPTKVNASTLDKLVVEYNIEPKLIKIDAEGVENLVFAGGVEVMKSFRPIIVSEVVDHMLQKNGSSSIELINKIKIHGYQVFDVLNPGQEINQMVNGNILCKPKP